LLKQQEQEEVVLAPKYIATATATILFLRQRLNGLQTLVQGLVAAANATSRESKIVLPLP
jgi:hypothetical protein